VQGHAGHEALGPDVQRAEHAAHDRRADDPGNALINVHETERNGSSGVGQRLRGAVLRVDPFIGTIAQARASGAMRVGGLGK
jgi:hypothetical protein